MSRVVVNIPDLPPAMSNPVPCPTTSCAMSVLMNARIPMAATLMRSSTPVAEFLDVIVD